MNTVEKHSIACIICDGTVTIVYKGLFDDRYGCPGLFDIYRCASCKSFQTEPRLRPSEIGPLYTSYYPRQNIDAESVRRRGTSWKPQGPFRQWLSGEHRIHHRLPGAARPGMRILDIGCGDGSSLLELRSLGYDAYGIETDSNVIKVRDALDLNLHIGTIENAPFPEHSFDCIIANQVIEHVVDLDSFCASIKRFLAPNGIVILSTPNAKSMFRALYGRRWIHWHIPYHQQILSARGLDILLRRHGLKAVGIRTVSPASWTMHEINRLRFKAEPRKKNPFWTDPKSASPEEKAALRSSSVGKIGRKLAFYGLQCIGKIADLSGYGNCLIISAVKIQCPITC